MNMMHLSIVGGILVVVVACSNPPDSLALGDEQEDCWVSRAAPRAADDLSVGFVLDDDDHLYLDIQPDGDPERVHIDVLDLKTGDRELFYEHAEGPAKILGAGLGQQMILTSGGPQNPTVLVRRNGEWKRFAGGARASDFRNEAGSFSGSRQSLVVGQGYNSGVLTRLNTQEAIARQIFDRVRQVTFADGYVAARYHFTRPQRILPERISLARPSTEPSRRDHDFTHALDNQTGADANRGVWILDETVIWWDWNLPWRYTLGDEAPVRMNIDPLCEILDVKAGTLLVGCQPGLNDRIDLHYSSLHWLRDGVWNGPIETAGTFIEAVLLNEQRAVWREWDDRDELWEQSSGLKGEIMTADLSDKPRIQRLGGSFGYDRIQHYIPVFKPYLVAKGNSVAWNYDYSESGSYDEVAIGTATYVCGTPDPF